MYGKNLVFGSIGPSCNGRENAALLLPDILIRSCVIEANFPYVARLGEVAAKLFQLVPVTVNELWMQAERRADIFRSGGELRHVIKGTRIAIVNDVINAGSVVRGAFEDLQTCGADIAAIGSLLTLGNAAQEFADARHVALESLVYLPNNLWVPAVCPLCASGIPLEDAAGFRNALAGRSSAVQ